MTNFYKDFYPTPVGLIRKMLEGVDWYRIHSILEPSAGKGDILDYIKEELKYKFYRNKPELDIECIEINPDLRSILKGKGYRVVHDDFLTFTTFRRYDLIIMNPPFSDGDKHLLKALELQERGGNILCLLNAETIRNPFSKTRQDLIRKLEDYNASIEFIEGAFLDAERKTDVDVALIKVHIPVDIKNSVILDHLEKAKEIKNDEINFTALTSNDLLEAIVRQYQYEAKLGCQLIQDFRVLQRFTTKDFGKDDGILKLVMNDYDQEVADETKFIRALRYKYWKTLFQSDKFAGVFTSNLRRKYLDKLDELKGYEFSLYNIYQIRIDMNNQLIKSIEEAIIDLFDELSHKYHYYNETSKNIHYYNGWKTNKGYKINKRVVIPLNAFSTWNGEFYPDGSTASKLRDIEKVFDYLAGKINSEDNILDILNKARADKQSKKIRFKYFEVSFYKKGTCHITFLNDDLLKKFNLYGSQRKGWLPPTYGKVRYEDMTEEEKRVVDAFEGRTSYEEIYNNREFYLFEPSVLLLTEGEKS